MNGVRLIFANIFEGVPFLRRGNLSSGESGVGHQTQSQRRIQYNSLEFCKRCYKLEKLDKVKLFVWEIKFAGAI